jgi:hypothetical protein
MHPVHRCLPALIVCAFACAPEEDLVDGLFTPAEWEKIQKLSPLEDPPDDPTNRWQHDARAAALGQKFFFETDYSGPLQIGDDGMNGAAGMVGETGKLACASCHQGPWLIDLRSQPGTSRSARRSSRGTPRRWSTRPTTRRGSRTTAYSTRCGPRE